MVRAVGLWMRVAVMLLVAGGGPLVAQVAGRAGDFYAEFPAEPPASYVLDEADLFRHDTETLKEISGRLEGFDQRHGMPIYLSVHAGLIGTTTARRAIDLHRAWLGEEYGFVLVYDTDTGELGLGRPFEAERSAGTEQDSAGGRIPSYELLEIMLGVNERLTPVEDRVEHIDAITREMVAEFESCIERLEAPVSRGRRLRFGLILIGVIAGIGLIALFLCRVLGRVEAEAGRAYRLPEVLVGQRLGAAYGGGRISARVFREPPEGE